MSEANKNLVIELRKQVQAPRTFHNSSTDELLLKLEEYKDQLEKVENANELELKKQRESFHSDELQPLLDQLDSQSAEIKYLRNELQSSSVPASASSSSISGRSGRSILLPIVSSTSTQTDAPEANRSRDSSSPRHNSSKNVAPASSSSSSATGRKKKTSLSSSSSSSSSDFDERGIKSAPATPGSPSANAGADAIKTNSRQLKKLSSSTTSLPSIVDPLAPTKTRKVMKSASEAKINETILKLKKYRPKN
jgi:hypothetical protein